MLPKVATTILHHTTRAVAAVQGQTGYAFRNVLQSSSGGTTTANWTGASGSGWGGAGAGTGGAKYNSSSRFYNGYTGSGRAVTQANQSTSNDSGYSQNDDSEDVQLTALSQTPRKFRARSNSLALGSQGRNERADKMGVLKIVQLHARASHAFAVNNADDSLESDSSRPTLIRRNSTSSATSSPSDNLDLPSLVPHGQRLLESSDPAAPQSVTPPFEDHAEKDVAKIRDVLLLHLSKQGTGDLAAYMTEMLDNNGMPADVDLYDLALEALSIERKPGTPITLITRVYDDMNQRGLIATARTYTSLIKAMCDRDFEVHRVIALIQGRITRREIANRATGKQQNFDVEQVAKLKAEDNIRPAVGLFQSACAARLNIPPFVYAILIRSCAVHSDEYAALRIFAHLEKDHRDQIPIAAFSHMIALYGNARNLDSAVETFNEFKKASVEGRVLVQDETDPVETVPRQIYPWNNMIEVYFKCGQPAEAISLLEQMMDSNNSASGTPLPSAATFQTVISGFCSNGDFSTGLKWFRRLLREDYIAPDSFTPLTRPPRPNVYMWRVMIQSLVEKGMVEDLNELIVVWLKNQHRDGTHVAPIERLSVMEANLKDLEDHPELGKEHVLARLEFVLGRIAGATKNWVAHFGTQNIQVCDRIVKLYVRHDELDKATRIFVSHIEAQRALISIPEPGTELQTSQMQKLQFLRKLVLNTTERLVCCKGPSAGLTQATKLAGTIRDVGLFPSVSFADAYVAIYEETKEKGQLGHITQQDAEQLIAAGVTLAYVKSRTEAAEEVAGSRSLARFESLLVDMATYVKDLSALSFNTFEGILRALLSHYPEGDLQGVFNKLGPAWQAVWNHTKIQRELSQLTVVDEKLSVSELTPNTPITPSHPEASPYTISRVLTRSIDDILNNYKDPSPLKAYNSFLTALQDNTYPFPDSLGRLINALGRIKEVEKVRYVYEAAQHALSVLEKDQASPQSAAWFDVEDQMIVALAHGGDIEGAHAHRSRMLQYGRAPSADAYGALIRCVNDTTDDSANAYDLFRESQIHGVAPNVYLYNTMISKLAKARKANYAMELFHKMKANGFWPSSVSYGAVIGACCRVGDYQSAEVLFQEMSVQPNFKPRIPPYNTMMQLYTYTKPNRERVLYYYNALLEAKVCPTAHTYKLLMDAHGTIDPIDLHAMEDVFSRLIADRGVQVQGTHWSSLIHTYGCVNKDLDKAIQVFNSISTHPSTLKAKSSLPDAVTYEALINVFVTLRRTDLIAVYMDQFVANGVRMTAYIANLLIKGYAVAGDLERARGVFESLIDPPQGVAAQNNHAPHESTPVSLVSPNTPVYREPSTWEAMVRAELGNGNRDQAVALLERMRARQFPSAVYSRISGIMLDDAVSPWPAPSFSPPEMTS